MWKSKIGLCQYYDPKVIWNFYLVLIYIYIYENTAKRIYIYILFAVILVHVSIFQNPCIVNYIPKFFNNNIQTNL